MKTTGVIRRIDELGRIVIPKEIRKNLRIKDGENIEIFIEGENIILKKHSILDKIKEDSKKIVDVVNYFLKKNVIVTDRDSVVAVSGNIKKEYNDKQISSYLNECIENRKQLLEEEIRSVSFIENMEEQSSYCIVPVISDSDVDGLVIITSEEKVDKYDLQICQIVAKILSKSLED